jgi:hypothetical protein
MLRLVKKSPRDEMDEILQDLVDAAAHLLRKNREFHPIAVKLTGRQDLIPVMAGDEDEFPESTHLIDMLVAALRADAADRDLVACGIASDVVITNPETSKRRNAIWVAIEHRRAPPIDCHVPYEWSGSQLILHPAECSWATPRIFPPSGAS